MVTSRIKNPLSLLKKQPWPDPELSITSAPLGVKGRLSYWDADGPAREAYNQIYSELLDKLNEFLRLTHFSAEIVCALYMVGPTSSTAIPHIMFSCKQSKPRKQAVSVIRRSGLLERSAPGMEVGHWDCPPHLINLQLLASSSSSIDLQQTLDIAKYYLRPVIDPQNHSEAIAARLEQSNSAFGGFISSRTATVGGVLHISGKRYYLAPAHVFTGHDAAEDAIYEHEEEGAESDCKFGGFPNNDDLTDDEVDFMSQYSISPGSSDAESDSDADYDTSSDDDFDAYRTFEDSATWSIPIIEADVEVKESLKDTTTSIHPHGATITVDEPHIISDDLDYALIEAKSNDNISLDLPILSRNTVSIVNPGCTNIKTVTGSGYRLHGRLSGKASLVRVPYAGTFQTAYIVDFEGPLQPGDCGSIVRDSETDVIYGHLFLGSVEARVGYIMPAMNVIDHIEATLGDTVESHSPNDALTELLPTDDEPKLSNSELALYQGRQPPRFQYLAPLKRATLQMHNVAYTCLLPMHSNYLKESFNKERPRDRMEPQREHMNPRQWDVVNSRGVLGDWELFKFCALLSQRETGGLGGTSWTIQFDDSGVKIYFDVEATGPHTFRGTLHTPQGGIQCWLLCFENALESSERKEGYFIRRMSVVPLIRLLNAINYPQLTRSRTIRRVELLLFDPEPESEAMSVETLYQ
ncbi:hypothetical protein BJX99DRAFT_258183 [Aspergillus californicus]